MEDLDLSDKRHLDAAEGWLGLGNLAEARLELEQISAPMQAHPEVLSHWYHVHEGAKDWESAVNVARQISHAVPEKPFGWIHLAYALHELRRTQEAWDVLLPLATRFPEEYLIRYNLACYACQLGNFEDARKWLKRAVGIAGKDTIKAMALRDRDLEPMRAEIENL
jgi:predicted Zn-dependent protease